MNAARTPRQVAVLYAIFFVSGFCGLIYESIWSHYLKLLLGHAAYAQAVVLVVFVGGLALGAWLTGRFSERLRHPVLLYAVIEAAVGLFAFVFQRLFEGAAAWATTSFLPSVCGDAGACAASWLLAAALILPPSILLGATFPLMSAGVMRLGVTPGRSLSLLYFLNSFGAALGVLASGFLLIPRLGLPGTMLLAGAFNVLVALLAFGAWKTADNQELAASPLQAQPAAAVPDHRLLLAVAALTGLSSFVYEVVWIRMLTLVFGAATHSFELMLAPFILGLAIGAWWIRDRIDAAESPLRLLAIIQVAMGVLAVLTLPLYAWQFDAMAFLLRNLVRGDEGYAVFLLASGVGAALVMLPATICAGMTLPLITAILLRQGTGERAIGRVYGINTVGAILGVLLSVHLLMPAIGLKWSLATAAAIDVVLGVVLWLRAGRTAPRAAGDPPFFLAGRPAAVAAMAAAALVALPLLTAMDSKRLASGVFRAGEARDAGTILFHRDGKTATVTVSELNNVRTLKTNGKPDGASDPRRRTVSLDDHTVYLLGALGPLHHPRAERVAVIGMGTGTTSAVLLEVPTLKAVDTIEIEPMMVQAADLFRPSVARAFEDPRSRIVIDDARAHFSKTRDRYDIVVSEPSNPWVSGVASLFTTEFYRHVARHLADDGHFVQWLHLYESSPQVVGSIVGAFATVFPEFVAYSTNSADVVLVARKDGKPPVLDPATWSRWPALTARLAEIGITSPHMLMAHASGPSAPIRLLARSYGAPPNSDYFPYVDNHAAKDRFRRSRSPNLFNMQQAAVPVLDYFTGVPPHVGHVLHARTEAPEVVRFAAAGVQAMRALRGEPLSREDQEMFRGLDLEIAAVRAWSTSCTIPAGTGGAWTGMVRLASFINPAVQPEQGAPLWKDLRQRCASKLSASQLQWLDLLAAVAARDAAASATHGSAVLAADAELTVDTRAYATLAAVTGLLAKGDRAAAATLLNEQRRKLPPLVMEQPWFRYLVLVLASRQQQP